jgi:tetratricopeptide (TPR) repeat protein
MVKIKNILLLLAFFGLISCSQYYRIDEQYDKGEFQKAYNILQGVHDRNNSHYQRRYYRIVTRLALNGDTNFIAELRTMTLSNGNDTREFANYAHFANTYGSFLAAVEPGQYSAVISALRDLKKIPDEFLVYAFKVRGISFYKTGNYTNAVADLSQSYGMVPYVDSLYFIGLCYFNQEDHRTAASYFNRVIGVTQNPFFVSLAYYQLGEIDYYAKKYTSALEKYVEAVNRYSDSADYAMKINRCLRKLKYYTVSPKFAKIALRIRSDYADAWFFLNMN